MSRDAGFSLELFRELRPGFVDLELDAREGLTGDAHPRRYRSEGEAGPLAVLPERMERRVSHKRNTTHKVTRAATFRLQGVAQTVTLRLVTSDEELRP